MDKAILKEFKKLLRAELTLNNDEIGQQLRAELSQTEQRLTDRIDGVKTGLSVRINQVQNELKELGVEMQEGFAGVGAPIMQINDNIEDHNKRLKKLEVKAA